MSAREVTVAATDYAFLPLPAIRSGPTLIAFVNRGKVDHEVAIARLRSDVSVDQFLKAPPGPQRRALMDGFVGVLITEPGKTAAAKLSVDLSKGATYMVWCSFRDKPDSPPHIALGMYTAFTPR
ncbi:MAG TPA: hypothetical protein VJ840_01705 [Gemmatimonadaceae bacterium]|nr:hypothetical protein [Gemmatimonadaceae bacterium]